MAGFGADVSASASLSASAGLSASADLSVGLSAGVSASASFGLGLGASAVGSASSRLAGTFNFRIELTKAAGGGPTVLGDGGFQECSGLDVEMDVAELVEGGRNDGIVRRVGRGKYSNLVLKRGMLVPAGGTVDSALWGWLQGILEGVRPVPRYDGAIHVLDGRGVSTVATWLFFRGLPSKIAGPSLNAKTGEVAIEELTIAHEGLRLRVT